MAREAIRHHHTAIQRAVTTTAGAPRHRVQNPANIGKPAGVGEALRPQGKGGSPTYGTSAGRRGQKKAETPKGNPRQGKLRKTAGAGGGARHKAENKRRSKDTANPIDIAPPQEQDRHLEPERLRNPVRVRCGKPQEEAQKQTPVRGSTNAYPAQSRRREGRHSSTASERTHRNTQGQPWRRSSAKNCKASHRRRWPKRRTGRRS